MLATPLLVRLRKGERKKYQSHSNCEVLKGPRGTGSSSSRHLTDTGGAFHHYSCADFSAPLPGPQGATSFLLSASPAGHQRVTAPPATSCFFFDHYLEISPAFPERKAQGCQVAHIVKPRSLPSPALCHPYAVEKLS